MPIATTAPTFTEGNDFAITLNAKQWACLLLAARSETRRRRDEIRRAQRRGSMPARIASERVVGILREVAFLIEDNLREQNKGRKFKLYKHTGTIQIEEDT